MKGFNFPIFKTKVHGVTERFRLEDPVGRRRYFEAKAGKEIELLRDYLRTNTFLGILLGPKNAGKGTYTKLLMELFGEDRIVHVSVGDIVRDAREELSDPAKRDALVTFLKDRYRGFVDVAEIPDLIEGHKTEKLLPSEAILTLIERKISRIGRKTIFIDGFPRDLDQISYALYFRALMGYRDDPDVFVFIDVSEAVIDERMKYRVICPLCRSPRNTKLFRTKDIGYDESKSEFYLICDNPRCEGFGASRMVGKEGDELGIEAVRPRVEKDQRVMEMLMGLHGVPKIYLRNSVPVAEAKENIDDYEITPAYRYEVGDGGTVRVIEEPWTVTDDNGVEVYSLLAPPVAVALIKQLARALGLLS